MSFKRATLDDFLREITRVPCAVAGWTNCYEFHGSPGYNGYRLFRRVLPSLVAVGAAFGRLPSSTVHRCGNKNCVNIRHLGVTLFPDPEQVARGPLAKLTLSSVRAILAARPGDGARYSVAELHDATGLDDKSIKAALRMACVFDVMDCAAPLRMSKEPEIIHPPAAVAQAV